MHELILIALVVTPIYVAVAAYLEARRSKAEMRKATDDEIKRATATAEGNALKAKYADRYLTMEDAVAICAGLKEIHERHGIPITITLAAKSDTPAKLTLSSVR